MDGKNIKKSADSRRAGNFFAVRLAVAAYLVYLGFDLLRDFLAGASTLSAAAAWGFGLGFMAAGLGFGVYSFLRYRRETAKEKAEETGKTPEGD